MKILTKNELLGGTVSSAGASGNYPARNLLDTFLRLRYQGNVTSDSITIDMDHPADFNSFFVGYIGNVASISVVFLSNGNVQDIARSFIHATGDGNIRVFEPGVVKYWAEGPTDHFNDYSQTHYASRHFPTLTNIDSVRIDITGTSPVYIGGVAGGVAIDMPPAIGAWRDDYEDNSSFTRSPGGQVQQSYVEPLDVYNFSFDQVKFEKFYEVKDAIKALGAGGGAWVTFFEDSESEFPPMYCTLSMGSPERERHFYSFDLTFTEAR